MWCIGVLQSCCFMIVQHTKCNCKSSALFNVAIAMCNECGRIGEGVWELSEKRMQMVLTRVRHFWRRGFFATAMHGDGCFLKRQAVVCGSGTRTVIIAMECVVVLWDVWYDRDVRSCSADVIDGKSLKDEFFERWGKEKEERGKRRDTYRHELLPSCLPHCITPTPIWALQKSMIPTFRDKISSRAKWWHW